MTLVKLKHLIFGHELQKSSVGFRFLSMHIELDEHMKTQLHPSNLRNPDPVREDFVFFGKSMAQN